MLTMIAAALATAQTPPARPVPVAVRIADTGNASDRAGLERLLFQVWNPRGTTRAIRHFRGDWAPCITGAQVDAACVQARLPERRDRRPMVALFALPGHSVFGATLLCVGQRDVGRASISNMAVIWQPGELSRAKNNDRTAVAQCINAAAPGAVTGLSW